MSESASFTNLVYEVLGISMEEFRRDIYDDEKFPELRRKARVRSEREYPQPVKNQLMQMKEQQKR